MDILGIRVPFTGSSTAAPASALAPAPVVASRLNGMLAGVKPAGMMAGRAAIVAGGAAGVYFGVKMALEAFPKIREAVNTKKDVFSTVCRSLVGVACTAVGLAVMCKTLPRCRLF